MKKILIVMPSLYNGGAERSLVNMLIELPPEKYDIDLLLLKKTGMFLKQIPSNVNVLDTPKDVRRLYSKLTQSGIAFPIVVLGNIISRLFTSNSRERRGMRWKYFYGPMIKPLEKHYDVALAYISGEILYFVDEKVSADRKIVWIHNDYRSAMHPKKYDYLHLKNMDAIVSISDSCVQILLEEFPEFSDKIYKLENITSSVGIRKRSEEFFPNEFKIDALKILSIGRLHEQQGFDLAIKAAANLKERNIKFLWLVIGTGELHEELENQIKSEGLQDYFELIGARENPYCYIKHCDIFVQPSRYEGKSVVLDEAKIIGAPIVVSAYPTINDQLVDGKEGIVVNPTAEGIAEGIQHLATHPKECEKLKNNLLSNEYGNISEINKYIKIIEG